MLFLLQVSNAVSRDTVPWSFRDRQRYELARRLLLQVLVLLADRAASHILTYGCVHARPPVHALHTANSPVTTHMACIVGVMQLVQYCVLELRDVWHDKCITPVVQPLIYIKIGCVACRCKPGVCFIAPVDCNVCYGVLPYLQCPWHVTVSVHQFKQLFCSCHAALRDSTAGEYHWLILI